MQHPPEASVKIHQVLKVTETQKTCCLFALYSDLSCVSFFFFVPGVSIQSRPANPLLLVGVGGRSSSGWRSGGGSDAEGGRHVQPAVRVQILLQRGQRRAGERGAGAALFCVEGFHCVTVSVSSFMILKCDSKMSLLHVSSLAADTQCVHTVPSSAIFHQDN